MVTVWYEVTVGSKILADFGQDTYISTFLNTEQIWLCCLLPLFDIIRKEVPENYN